MCPQGEGCYLTRDPQGAATTQCFSAGTSTSGACQYASDCAAGYLCLSGATYGCLKMCGYPNGTCPTAGDRCNPVGLSGTLSSIGYCRSTP
jgi:hypothetical protein